MFAYVGCRTTEHRNARGKGINVYDVNGHDWKLIQTFPILDNPSYFCLDRNKNYLYTVLGDLNDVSAFKIKEDGSLGDAIYVAHIAGLTPEGVSHAHQCELDQTGNWLLVPTQGRHIGYERVYVFKVNNDTGELVEHFHIDARTYAEPRTLAVSKDNKRVYLMNEKGNSVTYYRFDDQAGTLEPRQIIPSIPETYTGQGQASAVLISPNQKFLYGTNRIHESVVSYRINEETGFLTTLGYNSVLGLTPRFFMFSPDGEDLIIANEDSDTIRIFKADPVTGALTFSGTTIETGSPTTIVFK